MTDYAELLERLEAEADTNDRYGYHSRAEFMIEAATAIRTLIAERDAARKANDTALAIAMQAGADAERERTLNS